MVLQLCLALAISSLLLSSCGGPDTGAPVPLGAQEGASHPMVGRVAPDFMGDPLIEGKWLSLRSLRDRPVALLFLRLGAPFALELAREFGRLHADSSFAPTLFTGVVRGTTDEVWRWVRQNNITLPVLRDTGTIARTYAIGDLPTVILLDANHIVRFRLDGYLGRQFRPRLEATIAALRLLPQVPPPTPFRLELSYAENPRAPVFTAHDLDGRPVSLAGLRGKAVVLYFFDLGSPEWERVLSQLIPVLREFRTRGVAAIGITSGDIDGGLRDSVKERGIDHPVVLDYHRAISTQFSSKQPLDIFIIDREGFIRFREREARGDLAALTRLQLRIALGNESPEAIAADLPGERYLGDAVCAACHRAEYRHWLETPHSVAWDSLHEDGKWRDPECVGCHVTAAGEAGGFADPETTPYMTNVQCEVCHGAGGGHPVGAALDTDAIRGACVTCHTGEFVLRFDLDEAISLVSHGARPDMEKLFQYSDLKRQRLVQINERRLERFKSGVPYVGAGKCRECHPEQYEHWRRSPHAGAFARLVHADRTGDESCTPCHTTGAGSRRGFGDLLVTASMTNVQCEVCHGPGEDHINLPPDLKSKTIYGITGQSSSRDVRNLCLGCHDEDNDPHFDFSKDLPPVRH